MTAPLVVFQHLAKRYGKGPLVLEDFSLAVEAHEFISFIGPSGCGKSTVLKLVAGLTSATQGEIRVGAHDGQDARESLFLVFQEANLLPWLRVRDNVALPLKLRGTGAARREARVDEMIELVGLREASAQFPRELSAGMRMRVAIARALSISPQILLLDEPFAALDEMTRDKLNEELLDIRQRDPFTAFFVTHSVAEAVFLSSRVVVMSAKPGRVATVIDVPFAYPRRAELRESTAYLRLLAQTTHALREVNCSR